MPKTEKIQKGSGMSTFRTLFVDSLNSRYRLAVFIVVPQFAEYASAAFS